MDVFKDLIEGEKCDPLDQNINDYIDHKKEVMSHYDYKRKELIKSYNYNGNTISKLDKGLLDGIIFNNMFMIDIAINNNANLKIVNKFGLHLLHICIIYNRYDILKQLIETDHCDVNVVDDYGNTPLMLSIYKFMQLYIDLLINNGANMFIKNKFNLTAVELIMCENQLHNKKHNIECAKYIKIKVDDEKSKNEITEIKKYESDEEEPIYVFDISHLIDKDGLDPIEFKK